MRNRVIRAGALLAAPTLLAAAAALSSLSFQTGSRVWVEGTSSTRGYRCESTRVQGSASATTVELSELRSVAGARVTVPVATLDCRNGTMNGHMRRALKSDEHPEISFHARTVTLAPAAGGESGVRMVGDLTIAGETRAVTVEGTAVQEEGRLRVRGAHRLSMTDFGVSPPSLMMGAMRVHAPVTIGFDVVLR